MLRELDAIVKLGGKEAAAAFLAVRNLLHEFAIYIFDPTDPLTTLPQEVKKRAAEIEAERRKTGSAPNGDSSYDGDDISMAPQDAASGAVSMDSDLPVVEQAFIDVIRDKGRGPQDDIADKIARKFAAIEALNLPPDQEKLEKVQYLDKIRQSLKEQRKIAEQVGTKEQVDAISVLVGLLADFLKFSMDPASLLPEDVAKRVAEIEAERRKAGGAPDGDSSDDGDDIALAPQITDNMAAAMGGDLSVEEEAFIDVIRDKRRGPNDDIAGKIARKFAAIEALNLPPEEETREKLQYLNKIHRDLQEQRNVAL
ncbi:MAG TPA: hypothetical protein VLA37_13995, partial [Sphingomonadaceae bacterium]|nr:hypothetical protein [Sphingomonadaceae bacterium]